MYLTRRRLTGLERWLLERFCRQYGIDTQEIDDTLTYHENMRHLRELVQPPLTEEQMLQWARMSEDFVEEVEERLINDCKAIAKRGRRNLKRAKYDVGRRILQDEDYLNAKYGTYYFAELAKKINEVGYGPDQLRKCVKFARNAHALEWVEDDNITWEKIRTTLIRDSIGTNLIFEGMLRFAECPEVLTLLVGAYKIIQRVRSEHGEKCENCAIKKSCNKIVKDKNLKGFLGFPNASSQEVLNRVLRPYVPETML